MKRRFISSRLINHADANAKELLFYTDTDGVEQVYGLHRLATKLGIPYTTFLRRWKAAGKPDHVNNATFKKHPRANAANQYSNPDEKPFLLLPDGTRHFASELDKLFNVSASTLNSMKRAGKTVLTRDELYAMRRDRETYKPGNGLEKYADPNYLPNVRWGDLAHLSGSKNTGAAINPDAEHWNNLNKAFSRESGCTVARVPA